MPKTKKKPAKNPRWSLFQVVVRGQGPVNVAKMTSSELRDALCDTIDIIEAVNVDIQRATEAIQRFTRGG